MLSKIVLLSIALVSVGVFTVLAVGADGREDSAQSCCGAKSTVHDAAPAKDAVTRGCPMEAATVNADSCPMAAKPTTRPAAATTVYTCSMHPEVAASKPGKCPKCGMNLVARQEKPKGDQKPADKGDADGNKSGHSHNH
jgi:hypothetical protein